MMKNWAWMKKSKTANRPRLGMKAWRKQKSLAGIRNLHLTRNPLSQVRSTPRIPLEAKKRKCEGEATPEMKVDLPLWIRILGILAKRISAKQVKEMTTVRETNPIEVVGGKIGHVNHQEIARVVVHSNAKEIWTIVDQEVGADRLMTEIFGVTKMNVFEDERMRNDTTTIWIALNHEVHLQGNAVNIVVVEEEAIATPKNNGGEVEKDATTSK